MDITIDFLAQIIFSNDLHVDPFEADEEIRQARKCAKIKAEEIHRALRDDQKDFIRAAVEGGFQDELRLLYSGRGMFGQVCPAVTLGSEEASDFGFKGSSSDSLGKGVVVYMA